jgi:acyl transferase domain-containing protein
VGQISDQRATPASGAAARPQPLTPNLPAEPIALVGLSCRLPQAADPAAFWRLLRDGTDALTDAAERWGTPPGQRRAGFLAEVAGFDAGFFGISPHEAAAMDPQQRLVLELAWEALEQAGIVPAELRESQSAVFIGAIAHDYAKLADRLGNAAGPHSYTGTHRALIANRVSYFLRLQGPSLTVDTGQSSSLVAVQLACESLRRGESRLALAGGVNLNLLGETTEAIGRFGALSPDGRCYTFDERANGYARGEGAAVVVLKRLSDALADGDRIRCVLLGGAINNDGGGTGLTAPSQRAQQQVIERACAQAGIAPADLDYVELHGTGTPVGDPIEAAALSAARGQADAPLLVGSVKTNIGHLEGAAGIAGLVKVALSLTNRTLPASLNFDRPPASIPLAELGLEVVGDRRDWSRTDRPLLAGISSFGMGGTNCHLVLAEYRQPAAAEVDPEPETSEPVDTEPETTGLPWLLSARSGVALRASAGQLRELAGSAEPASVALALAGTRDRLEHRAVLLGEDPAAPLAALADGLPHAGLVTGHVISGQTALTFPGQGSQWPEMARELLANSPVFAVRMAACAQALAPFVDFSLLDVLRGMPGAADFDRVDVVQPALWAMMVSLAEVWRAAGVQPDVVIGHSQGEIAAATAIGALSLTDGARVVALRSKAIVDIAGSGGMMSVAAELDVVEAAVADRAPGAAIAAINGTRSVVVSGTAHELAELSDHLTAAGYRTKIIPVDYASHSPAVEQLREQLAEALAPVAPRSVPTVFISTLTGEPMDTAGLDADYWFQSLRRPVRFQQAARRALETGCRLFLECSPHPVLVGALEETFEQDAIPARAVGTLRRGQGDRAQLRQAFAEAWVSGAPVDWLAGRTIRPRQAIELPSYPFQRGRHWLPELAGAATPATQAPVLAAPVPVTSTAVPGRTRRQLRELVLATAAAALGHADAGELEPSRTFKELGVDSAIALELRNRLRALTGLDLPTGLLFDHPTPDQLAGFLHELTEAGATDAEAGEPVAATVPAEPIPTHNDEIAIVSMGCRFPGGVTSPAEFWQLIAAGAEAIGEFPDNRGWDTDALFSDAADRAGTSDTSLGGFLHDADRFDAPFFGISPREALAMDPQQRLVLEICWEALEQGGLDPHQLRGSRTGVFVGAMAPDYGPRLHQPVDGAGGHLLTGTALSVVSGRVAYTFGLEGPAVTVDTACSSSLVAIHLAAQALRRGECTLALAGGVTVMSTPGMFVEFSRQGGLAADGRCKAFSADADGTSWAEGAGVLLLERLSDARRNGHPVLAVIRGSAINQDGRSNGLTAPSGTSQERVIRAALADAGLTAAEVDAVEAHGTGTKLGDPIEAEALLATYGRQREADRPLWLGSVKSNIGHTQAAAGVAGVIKMVLAMRHGTLPKTLHVAEPTPHVAWDPDALRLLAEPVRLAGDRPARAAVSAFGISGTNGHVILEATPDLAAAPAYPAGDLPTTQADSPLVWLISGRTQDAVRSQAARLTEVAERLPEAQLAIAGQLLAARSRFEHRAAVVAADRSELLAALAALTAGTSHPALVTGEATTEVSPVFVFPGQGSQWAGMAADLIEVSPAFGDQLRQCDEALRPHTGWSVLDVLRGAEGAPELAGSDVIQPVLFAVMVSLAALWRSAGVQPAAVLGHSQGELAAACAAGAIGLADAARVVALRSRALLKLTGTGGMLAVALPTEQAGELIGPWQDRLWPAIFSGPASTVIAGDLDALEEFTAAHGERVRIRRVAIDYAAHTPHIEAIREELAELLAGLTPRPTEIEFCSALHGEFRDAGELAGDYWYQGLRHPVRLAEAVLASERYRNPLFIETSPHPVLTAHVQDSLRSAGLAGDAIGSLRRNENGWRRFLLSAAEAYVRGAELNWPVLLGTAPAAAVSGGLESGNTVALPSYPFDRRRYWLADTGSAPAGLAAAEHPLLTAVVPLADTGGYLLTGRLTLAGQPWLADHAVGGSVLLPGTAFVELALQAARLAGCAEVADLTLQSPLVLPESGATQLQVLVGGADESGYRAISLHSRPAADADWVRHATGLLGPESGRGSQDGFDWPPVATEVELDRLYDRLADGGYDYGPTFQGLRRGWRDETAGYVEVALPEPAGAAEFAMHPALLDAALHLLVLDAVTDLEGEELLLPFAWSGVRIARAGAANLRVRLTATGEDRYSLTAQDEAGREVATVESLVLRRTRPVATPGAEAPALHQLTWLPGQASEQPLAGERWAVVGVGRRADELSGQLAESGAEVSSYYDLVSVADLTDGEVAGTVLAPVRTTGFDADEPADGARAAAAELLELLQSWLADPRFETSRLVLVTDGAAGPGDKSAEATLAGSAVWGLVRAAAAEHPDRFGLIDTDSSAAWPLVAGQLAAGEWQLAVRDGAVLVPRLAPVPADSAATTADSAVTTADSAVMTADLASGTVSLASGTVSLASGTVLVTGGTGGLGALVAERLVAEHGVRSLVLLSRSGPAASGAAELVERLTGLGAEVAVEACDVSDRAALARVIGDRRLSGVLHAAGVLADAPVDRLSEAELAATFGAKADAAWYLHELTAGHDLAAFVLFSSVAAVVGNAGQGSYAAANGFLDALAEYRHGQGQPATSVAWGLWDTPTGMTEALSAADVARLGRAGVAPLGVEQGLQLFDQAVTGAASGQLVAAAWDARSLRERAEAGQLAPVLRSLTKASRRTTRPVARGNEPVSAEPTLVASRGGLAERLAGLAGDAARDLLSELIRSEVAAVLGFAEADSISPAHAFSELGFDSLTVVDLRNRLDAVTGLRLPATLAFDYPTVTALLDHLMRTLAPAAVSAEDGLAAQLDELERTLPDADPALRGKVIALLHSTLARLEAVPAGPDGAEQLDVHEQILTASDDEIFAFIDTQL